MIGTAMAPIVVIAKYAIAQLGWFSLNIATLSPAIIPSLFKNADTEVYIHT